VAFVRSVHAHARLREIDAGAAAGCPGMAAVVTGRDPDFARLRIRARSALPGYVETEQPILAWPVARYSGEAVAAVVGADRYVVEDAAALVRVDYEPLPAAVDVLKATAPAPRRCTRPLPGNAFLSRRFQGGDVEAALAGARRGGRADVRTNRQCAAPLEVAAGIADWSAGRRSSRCGRHAGAAPRSAICWARCSASPRNRIRVVAPDVGGGFGVKSMLYPKTSRSACSRCDWAGR
jgi:carbon-monoxide dehydrogenase large subunit